MNREQHSSQNEIAKFLEIAWRRKWVILLPFVLISVCVSPYALYLPNLYRSSTSLYTEPQKVPEDYVRSTVTSDPESRIRMITQQLHSRTKLLRVINELDLYPEEVQKIAPNEVLVAKMRKNMEVEIPGRREQNFFMIHFIHEDPTKAMLAVSRLVGLFIEESLQVREEQAKGTTLFIEEELAHVKEMLERQEASIQSFKRKYMGQLPSQLEANLRMLDSLQLQMSDNMESRREVENRILILEQEITRLEGQVQLPGADGDDSSPVNTTLIQLIEQRNFLQQEIGQLEAAFTAQHPDLITARKELARVEDRLRSYQTGSSTETDDFASGSPLDVPSEFSRELNNLRRQLNENRPRLASLLEEERDLKERVARYQARVEITPRREQQLLSLTRDYENTQQNYEDLLNKKLEAQLSENLEKRQKGEKFLILDSANLPQKPYLPNRIKIIFMGLAGGLGLGIGIALLLETLFPVFNSLAALKDNLNVPIIIGIPLISPPEEKRRRRILFLVKTGMTIGLIAAAFFLVDKYVFDLAQITERIENNVRSMRL